MNHWVQTLYMLGVRLPADKLLEWSKPWTGRVCCAGANMVLNQVHTRECFCLVSHKKTCRGSPMMQCLSIQPVP